MQLGAVVLFANSAMNKFYSGERGGWLIVLCCSPSLWVGWLILISDIIL